MTGPQFRAWVARFGLTQHEAGRLFRVSRRTIQNYADDGPPASVTLSLILLEVAPARVRQGLSDAARNPGG